MFYNLNITKLIILTVIYVIQIFMFTGCASADFNEDAMMLESTVDFFQSEAETVAKEAEVIYVYVCGQVVSPGVYELLQGARMIEAVEAAGGMTETAAPEQLNLAAVVADGDRIYVPDQSEAVAVAEGIGDPDSGLVNINTADKSQLMTLPGIGEAKADSIIVYRESHGGFQSIEGLTDVPGIKSGVYEQLKDMITVG